MKLHDKHVAQRAVEFSHADSAAAKTKRQETAAVVHDTTYKTDTLTRTTVLTKFRDAPRVTPAQKDSALVLADSVLTIDSITVKQGETRVADRDSIIVSLHSEVDALRKLTVPRHHFPITLYVGPGYGLMVSGGVVHAGPVLAVGISLRF